MRLPERLTRRRQIAVDKVPLSIPDADAVLALYEGEVTAVVLVDRGYVTGRAKELGVEVKFVDDDEWCMDVTAMVSGEPVTMKVSKQFLARVAFEFLNLEWFVKEIVLEASRPPFIC